MIRLAPAAIRPFLFPPSLLALFVAASLGPAGAARAYADEEATLAGTAPLPATTATARHWGPTSVPSHYRAERWDTEDGLPQNTVAAIMQAHDGAIWVATNEGVARFDGQQFQIYAQGRTRGFPTANASSIAEGADGTIWIGTDGGLIALRNGRAKRYMHKDGLLAQSVTSLVAESDGTLWVGTTSGLNRWANGALTTLPEEAGLTGHAVEAIVPAGGGDLWLGSSQGALTLHGTVATPDASGVKLNSHHVRVVFQEKSGARWFVTNAEIVRLDGASIKRMTDTRGVKPSSVTAFAEDRDGRLWVGTTGGLMVYEHNKFVPANLESVDEHEPVLALFCDREGNLWIGGSGGLTRIRRTAFTPFSAADGLPLTTVGSVCQDTAGTLWVGTTDHGLVRVDKHSLRIFDKHSAVGGDNVRALYPSRDGSLWVGFDGAPPVVVHGDSVTPHPEIQAAVNAPIYVLFEDSRGILWIGARSGLWTKDGDKIEKHTGPKDIRLLARTVVEDPSGTIWAATHRGLARYANGKLDLITNGQGLPASNIHALSADADGTLWIGLTSAGLCWLQDGHYVRCTTKEGLPSDSVLDLVDDGRGNLWVCTPQGISRLAKSELKELGAGTRTRVQVDTYGRLDGLAGTEISTVAAPAGIRARNGRLWFATLKRLVTVDPAKLPQNEVPPPVLISAIRLEGTPTALQREIGVPAGTSEVEIDYTALSYAQPEKIRFRYQLEGVNAGWVEAGVRRTATYSRVPSGVRTFRVQAMNNDGVWSEHDATVTFRFTPRFYETWWFYGGVVAGVGLLAVGTHSLRTRALRRRQRDLVKLVEERTAHLEAQIAERKRAERELIEVSRIAGMAEVATNVLHNVGNVLNSVNVSASVAADLARSGRVENLSRVAEMLEQHRDDLGAFLAHDPRGKSIPTYLTKLAEHLGSNQTAVVAELAQLRKHVEHIKGVVSMQQNIARVGGPTEELPLVAVIEDTLTINADSLGRHHIELVRDFRQQPTVVTDRHKLVQVLLNLVENAKHACCAVERPDRRIVLRLEADAETARISVIDNGDGILPENLTRIFAHGFTTRKAGHGFGLHSSALIAKELGGKIIARSEGSGRGAEFVIELPLRHA